MIESFIITLREGVEAALIIGITLVYLAKIQRPELRKPVYAAIAAATLASVNTNGRIWSKLGVRNAESRRRLGVRCLYRGTMIRLD